jgi:hypothetical protein
MVRGLGSHVVVSSVHSYRVDYWNSCLNIYTDTHVVRIIYYIFPMRFETTKRPSLITLSE